MWDTPSSLILYTDGDEEPPTVFLLEGTPEHARRRDVRASVQKQVRRGWTSMILTVFWGYLGCDRPSSSSRRTLCTRSSW